MARKGKSTEEIIAFLREAEVRLAQGETAGKICRGAGISVAARVRRPEDRPSEAAEGTGARERAAEESGLGADARQADPEGSPVGKCMVHPVRARDVNCAESSLRKCIRPLASWLRLQPGHDEIRTRRSQ